MRVELASKKAAGEKKRQALAKKVAEEKKRQELTNKAAEEKKRQALAKKAAEEKKRKANEKLIANKTKTTDGGGELKNQLSILKQLHSDGLIDEQEFKTKKETLLSRFFGLNSTPPSKIASVEKPKKTSPQQGFSKVQRCKIWQVSRIGDW